MIYRYKATIKGNKVFLREYELDSSMTLFRLRSFLNNDLGFSQDQITFFDTFSAKGTLMRRIGMFDMGDGSMDRITLGDCIAKEEPCLRYVYNPSMKLSIVMENMGEADFNPRFSYPLTVLERGKNPDQFSASYDDYMEEGIPSYESEETAFEEDELPEGEEGA